MSHKYETPVGTFETWEAAAERVEALDMDPCDVIRIVAPATITSMQLRSKERELLSDELTLERETALSEDSAKTLDLTATDLVTVRKELLSGPILGVEFAAEDEIHVASAVGLLRHASPVAAASNALEDLRESFRLGLLKLGAGRYRVDIDDRSVYNAVTDFMILRTDTLDRVHRAANPRYAIIDGSRVMLGELRLRGLHMELVADMSVRAHKYNWTGVRIDVAENEVYGNAMRLATVRRRRAVGTIEAWELDRFLNDDRLDGYGYVRIQEALRAPCREETVSSVADTVLRLSGLRDEGRARMRFARARWTF